MKRRFFAVVWLSLVLLATGLTNAWTQDPNASVVQGSVTGTALPITGAVTSTVSGSVTSNQGTAGLSPWLVELNNWLPYPWQITFNGIAQPVTAAQSGSWTVGISGTPVVLSAQSGTWTVGVNNFPSSFGVTQGTSPWLIAGLLATDAGPPGATNLGTLSAIANAAAPALTEGNQVALSTDLSGNLRVVTTGGNTVTQGTSPWVVDGSGHTQPVSGTVTANAGSGTFTVGGTVTANQGTTPWVVNGSGVTQPVSGTVTANAGSGTFTVGGTVTANAGSGTFTVDGSGHTQPVSAASLPLPTGASTEASLTKLPLGQGSTTSGQSGPLAQGAVTTAAPTYTTAQTSPLSLTTAGALRVDGSAATQPVSGTVTANAGSGTFTVGGTVTANAGTGTFTVDGSGHTQPVSAASLPLPTGAATEATLATLPLAQGSTTSGQSGTLAQGAVTTAAPSYTTAKTSPFSLNTSGGLRVDGSAVTQPVSGTITANAGSGTFTVDGSGHTQPVSGTVTANQGGAPWSAVGTLTNNNAAPSTTNVGTLPAKATAAAPSWTEGNQVTLSTDLAGSQRVTVTNTPAVSQSGTWTVQQGSAPWSAIGTLSNNNAAPSTNNLGVLGAKATAAAPSFTEGNQVAVSTDLAGSLRTNITNTPAVSQSGTWNVGLSTGSNTVGKVDQGAGGSSAWKVDGSAVTQPVSGTVTANAGSGTFGVAGGKTNNNAAPGATNVGTLPGVANASAPSWTEGNQVALSSDLSGRLRTDTTTLGGTAVDVNSGSKGNGTQRIVIATDQPALTNALKVDGSAVTQPVSGTFWQASQPVSGTVTANAGTGTFTVGGTVTANAGTGTFTTSLASTAGTISTANSSTATLTSGSVFTGTGEDVSGFASIGVSVIADQASAAAGLSFQWSSNNSNWDVTEAYTVAVSTAQSFALVPRARYFRIVYTNGGTGQGAFRLQTVFRQVPLIQGGSSGEPLRIDPTGTTTQPANVSQVNGTTTDTNSGTKSNGTLRVVLATDQPALTNALTVTANAGTGTLTVAGGKTNNNAAPGATNVGTLGAVANASAPSWTEGNLVALSTDLSGALRTTATSTVSGTVTVAGNKTSNNAAPGATNIGALPAVANAAAPSMTEGNLVALSSDLSGRLRTDTSTVGGTAVDTNSGTKSNGTQRIVLATDQPALTNALKVDGSAVTQPVSGTVTVNQGTTPWAVTPSLVMVTATYTRPNNTTAYTAGDVISDSTTTPTNLTFTSCGRVSGGAGRVVGCVIVDSANQTTKAQLELYLFDTAPVATADNAVWAPSDTEANAIQIILSTNTTWAVGNVGAGATGNAFQSSIVSGPNGTPNSNPALRVPFKCVGSANLFGVLVVRNAFTPVALESFQIRLFIEQD